MGGEVKMHIVFSSIFWGVILVLLGISVILKAVFKIDIPVFRVVFAILLIYWGAKILFGDIFHRSKDHTVIFHNSQFVDSDLKKEYNVVFGRSEINLRNVDLSRGNLKTQINVVFGSSSAYIDPEIPTIIKVDTVFGESTLPDRSINAFGEYVYKSPTYSEGQPYLLIEMNVVFGSGRIFF